MKLKALLLIMSLALMPLIFTSCNSDDGPSWESIKGTWTLNYNWTNGSTTITFFSDHSFTSGEGNTGTWEQDDDSIDWYYDAGTHYWGTLDKDGNYMDGQMQDYSGNPGTWWANR